MNNGVMDMGALVFMIAVGLAIVVLILYTELNKTKKRLAALSRLEPYSKIVDIDSELKTRSSELDRANAELNSLLTEIQDKSTLLASLTSEETLMDVGFYTARYTFETSELFKNRLSEIREQQKSMIKSEQAAVIKTSFIFNGSEKEGRKISVSILKLALLAFNEECESTISKVKFGNAQKFIDVVRKAQQSVNRIVERWGIVLTDEYVENRVEELQLVYEYLEKVEAEREEQRMIREQMREEERAQRELEKARLDAEKEEQRSQDALDRARKELEGKQGAELDALTAKMQELERQLAEAHAKKERALSQAQLTKSGHVYVISNIGSFGEHVYKIGMTRRIEPLDRVKELGDASVPFEFDVHAVIYSDNAPELENTLHRLFHSHRLNKVNEKKEFFRVELDMIERAVQESQGRSSIEFTKIARAKEYRETLAKVAQSNQN